MVPPLSTGVRFTHVSHAKWNLIFLYAHHPTYTIILGIKANQTQNISTDTIYHPKVPPHPLG